MTVNLASSHARPTLLSRTLAAALLSLVLASTAASAAGFPDRPIRFLLGFGSGGPTDIVARTLAARLSEKLGQNVIVENKSGASGNIATQAVATADDDGYTFLIGANPLAINESRFPDFPFKFGKDIVAVAAVGATANVLVVRPSLGVKTLTEFVARARAKPDALTYATVGVGSSSHLAGLAFDRMSGSKMLPVVYRGGGDALKDLLGDRVDAWFATIPSVLELVKSGKLVALATTGPQRVSWLPDVPTMVEQGFPGYDVRLWVGLFARKGVPDAAMQTMERAVADAVASPDMRAALENQGIAPASMTRGEFAEFIEREIVNAKSLVATVKE